MKAIRCSSCIASIDAIGRGITGFRRYKRAWQDERDISDATTLRQIVTQAGFDAALLFARAQADEVEQEYRRNTELAIAGGVFGSPTHVYRGEWFWGQDRLQMLDETVAVG